MVDYKRILVPTDFSKGAQAAVPHAIHLAQGSEAQILAVHVVADPPYLPYGFTVEEVPIDLAPVMERVDQGLAEFAASFGEGIEVRTRVLHGNAYESLTNVAEEEDVDLIVMSTQGHSTLERFFLGSVTEKVIRHAPCPVMIVPAKA